MTAAELLLLALLVATWVVMLWKYRHLADAIRQVSEYRNGDRDLSTEVGRLESSEVSRLALQLQHAGEELVQALAIRSVKIEKALVQADHRLAALAEVQASLAKLPQFNGSVKGHATDHGSAGTHPASSWSSLDVAQDQPVPDTAMDVTLSREAATRRQPASPGSPATSESPTPAESLAATASPAFAIPVTDQAANDEIHRLAAEGLDVAAIAQRTNRGREEVRILLQLQFSPARDQGVAP
jgi:hypothetical protein